MGIVKRILIVEDERPLSHALELKLQHEGFETKVANNGKEALDILQAGEKFDLMLLDMMMPLVDGFHVLESLQKSKIAKPYTIALSNLSQHEDEERVLGLGADKYFIKSNTPLAVIVEEVEKL
jgi:DNA-binding response OmpR family regulator